MVYNKDKADDVTALSPCDKSNIVSLTFFARAVTLAGEVFILKGKKKMKKFNIVMIIINALLFAICVFQQLELWAVADEINNINEFVENQLSLNTTILDIIEMMVK